MFVTGSSKNAFVDGQKIGDISLCLFLVMKMIFFNAKYIEYVRHITVES